MKSAIYTKAGQLVSAELTVRKLRLMTLVRAVRICVCGSDL